MNYRDFVNVSVTLVIPTFDEADTIGACLNHALAQTRPFDSIIVVDNQSRDETVRIVEEYRQQHPQIQLMHESRKGVLHARTAGFNAVDSDVIARIDADTRLRPQWCETGLSILAADTRRSIGAVTGHTVFYDAPFQTYSEKMIRKKYPSIFSGTVISGNNTMIRRTAWEKCGSVRLTVDPTLMSVSYRSG